MMNAECGMMNGCWVLGAGCWSEPKPSTQHPTPAFHSSFSIPRSSIFWNRRFCVTLTRRRPRARPLRSDVPHNFPFRGREVSTEAAHADDREAILRVERDTMEAIRRGDVEALRDILADDFVYRTPGNADAGRAGFLNNIASAPVEVLSIWGEGLHVLVNGETAVL